MYLVRFNNNTVARGEAHYHLGNYLPFRLCVYFSFGGAGVKDVSAVIMPVDDVFGGDSESS